NLKTLRLCYNKLETLPVEIGELSGSLQFLDLRGNNILEEGDGKRTLGKKELREIFEDRVVFDGVSHKDDSESIIE
ncbi:uncharacterized protein VICG_02106, partial [Vittaforma corneae ATCC 50505]